MYATNMASTVTGLNHIHSTQNKIYNIIKATVTMYS